MLARLIGNSEREAQGMTDPFQEHRKRPLLEHLEDFKRFLVAKGNTPEYATLTHTRAKAVVEGCKFVRMADLSPSAVVGFLGELQKKGRSIQTSNYYLQAVKSFGRWLMKDRRAPDNPLAHLSRQNAKVDVRLERRSLEPEHFEALLKATREGRAVFGLSGLDREMLYLVTANTGFRASEMASLTADSFDLDGDPPTVTVAAAYSKRKRKDEQPIRPDLAAMLREFLAGRPPAAPVWPAEQRPRGERFIIGS
jgi:site-specific recombinase XerD